MTRLEIIEEFTERAGIRMIQGEMSREDAEQAALEDMRKRHGEIVASVVRRYLDEA